METSVKNSYYTKKIMQTSLAVAKQSTILYEIIIIIMSCACTVDMVYVAFGCIMAAGDRSNFL